jgi:signal transduction histidine kinase
MGAFDLLAGLTARLASTARLDEIVDVTALEIAKLGFGAVWIAVLDEPSGSLSTLKQLVDGADITHEMPTSFALDLHSRIGHGPGDHRMLNVTDPESVHVVESGSEAPPDKLALPRALHDHMRGRPSAWGSLLGSRGQSVGALGLSSYRGKQPIPDAVLSHGLLRAFMDHLGIAMERALLVGRAERLDASLTKAQAVIAADARIKAVGELATAVAHDLNNLAGIALLAVGVGLRSPADAVDALPRIERANRAIGDLVARLQRIARPSTGEPEAANLPRIVDDILMMVRPILREHSIEIEADLPVVPPVVCDPVLIHQVVLNLVLNAQDALAGVSVDRRHIKVRVRDDAGVVRLTIADTGPGIAPDAFARLFQPFVTTKGGAHLGLGLAAAHAALEQFGAQLGARNDPTGGAVFEVTFVAAALAPDAQPPLPPAAPIEAPRPARILAVDDDPDVVYVIRAYLEPLGYEVSTATGPAQAIAAASSQVFDLVLCDIGMPKQSGLDVCHALRSHGYRGKLVLMTGWETEALGADQRAAECDTMLKKPFVGTDLIRVIGSLLATA